MPNATSARGARQERSPAERSLQARLAAYAMHAKGSTNTVSARSAFFERFEREVDPKGRPAAWGAAETRTGVA